MFGPNLIFLVESVYLGPGGEVESKAARKRKDEKNGKNSDCIASLSESFKMLRRNWKRAWNCQSSFPADHHPGGHKVSAIDVLNQTFFSAVNMLNKATAKTKSKLFQLTDSSSGLVREFGNQDEILYEHRSHWIALILPLNKQRVGFDLEAKRMLASLEKKCKVWQGNVHEKTFLSKVFKFKGGVSK